MSSVNAPNALLIVVGEPLIETHVDGILQRVFTGLAAWKTYPRGFLEHTQQELDLNAELKSFLHANVTPENLEAGGFSLRKSSEHVYLEILVNPTVLGLQASLSHFLILPASYKHIVHAGPAFACNGSWILQDGTFSLNDFSRLLHRADVTTALTEITPSSVLTVSCFAEGEWNEQGVKRHGLDKLGHITLGEIHGENKIDESCIADLESYLQRFISFKNFDSLMPTSTVVGGVRFCRPTLQIFPAGQGEAALLGVSGFTMLFDGGFGRKTCFWDFIRHVDRVDAYLVSRLNNSNVVGISSFVDRLATGNCYPKLGHAFGNVPTYHGLKDEESELPSSLLVSAQEEGQMVHDRLSHIGLHFHPLAMGVNPTSKHPEPLTLYQKVGQGRLDMYVLNPVKDSKELNEFTDLWKKGIKKGRPSSFSTKSGSSVTEFLPPLSDQTSLAVLLVWHPSDPHEHTVRILYPGGCPQEKILQGLDKLKHLDFLKHSIYTSASLHPISGKTAPVPSKTAPKVAAAKSAEVHKSAVASKTPVAITVAPAGSLVSASALVQAHKVEESVDLFGHSPSDIPMPNQQQDLLQEFNQQHAHAPIEQEKTHGFEQLDQPHPTVAQKEDFIYREQLDAVESKLFGTSAATSVKTNPVEIGHPVEAGVLRLSSDRLDENYTDQSLLDVSPNLQQELPSALNPEAPAFIPKHDDTSPLVDFGFETHQQHITTAADPLLDLGEQSVGQSQDIGGFSNGSTNVLETDIWAKGPLVPSEFSAAGFTQEHQHSPEHKKKVDEAMKEWGEPMNLPALSPAPNKNAGKAAPATKRTDGASATGTTTTTTVKRTTVASTAKPPASSAKPVAESKPPATAAGVKKATPTSQVSPKGTVSSTKGPVGTSAGLKTSSVVSAPSRTTAAPSVKPTSTKSPSTAVAASRPASAVATTTKSTAVAKKIGPASVTYVDLAYIPHQGNPHYCNAEFFKQVRSKHYVLSTLNPSKEVLEALLTGKKTWNLPDESVTLIPTYDSDTLKLWMGLHKDELSNEGITVAPSCCRCTVTLEEHQGTTCAAYRLEL